MKPDKYLAFRWRKNEARKALESGHPLAVF